MKISKQARRDAKQLFRSCVNAGVLDEGRVRQAVTAVIAGKPRGYAPILSHFHHLVKLEIERLSGKVESAVALPAAEQASVEASLAAKYGNGLRLVFSQKAELLGGLRIQVGSDVYDGSVLARLESLKEAL